MTGKPIAASGLNCPLWRKDVSKCCHLCAWFTHIEGVHPQTGDRVDKWMCAQSAQVLATLDAGKAAMAGGAVTQELRNDLLRERQQQARLLFSQRLPASAAVPLLTDHAMDAETDR